MIKKNIFVLTKQISYNDKLIIVKNIVFLITKSNLRTSNNTYDVKNDIAK